MDAIRSINIELAKNDRIIVISIYLCNLKGINKNTCNV